MAVLNLRSKMDPSVFTEVRKAWTDRCSQVETRKATEKSIDKANKEIIKKLSDTLKNRVYLKNAKLHIRDADILLEKFYSIRDLRTNSLSYFSICTTLPPLSQLLATDKAAKDIPKTIENRARRLDRLTKRAMKNHGIVEIATNLLIVLETQTKYSF